MKVLFFYQYFGTPNGSWSTRVYDLAKRWIADGHKVTVVTAPYEKSDISVAGFIKKTNIEGIDLIVINSADSNKNGLLKRAFRSLVFSFVSIYYALFESCDIVISSSGPITVGIPALFAKWFRRKPFVFEVRDLWPLGAIELGKIRSGVLIKLGRWFERVCYKNASLVIPCSSGMENAVLEVDGNTETLVVPNVAEASFFYTGEVYPVQFPNILKGRSIFLYAGSLGFMDDCSQIIRGMHFVEDEDIVLVFLGDGAEREKLIELSGDLFNHRIFFFGLLPKTEVAKWMSVSIASFVTFKDFSVLHTSSPNKMFDSFAARLPIIQSTKGWIRRLVDEERCGINVDPDKPIDFAVAIDCLAKNRKLRDELAQNAYRLSQEVFNKDLLAKKYLGKLLEISASSSYR